MARNGSGTYSNPYPNFVSGTVISSAETDANNSDIATALTQSIAVDGQAVVTANLPMNAKKFTGLAVGAAATDSLSLGQAQAEAFIWCGTAGGSADAITLSPSPAITAYAAGQRFVWMASGSVNTGATTVAISGLGTIALQDNGAALVAGNHAASKMFMGILNTTSTVQIMQVQSSGTDPLIVSSLTVSGASVLTGVTTHGDDVVSDSDSTDDLGTTSVRWANLFVDGITATDQITATGFTGTLDGILGSGTPAAATVTTIDASGVATATTFEPDGDTSASDNAAIGYTSVEGLILTGQGSTNDVTIKNDADADVITIPTGTTAATFAGNMRMTKGGDIASASPLVIGTDGNYFDVTGTTSFAVMTVAAGSFFMLQFDGALTITHGSGIELPGGVNLTTATGDRLICYATAANTVEVMNVATEAVERSTPADNSVGYDQFEHLGTAGQLLTSNGTVSAPSYQSPAAVELGFRNISSWADSAEETVSLSSDAAAIAKAQVVVYEEISDTNQTNNVWDVATSDTGFDLVDSAYAVTVTPGATTGTSVSFTLGSGSWASSDIGKRIMNVSTSEAGEARIISISTGVATCTITTTFTDTNAIASGDWELYAGVFEDGAFALSSSTQDAASAGALVEHEDGNSGTPAVAKLTTTTAISVTKDAGNSNYGRATVITVSGTTVSLGTGVVFESAAVDRVDVASLSATKAIVVYRDVGNSGYGTACILDISGTTVTAGTPAVFESAGIYDTSVAMLTSTKAIVCYRDVGNSNYGTACILDVSGSTITAATPAVFESGASEKIAVTMLTSTQAIVAYQDYSNSSYGTASILNVSGSTITPVTPVVFESATSDRIAIATLTSSKAIVCYQDGGNSSYGTAIILDVSGSTITPATAMVFESASSLYFSVTSMTATEAMVTYMDGGNSNAATVCMLTISGSTITGATPVVFAPSMNASDVVAMTSSTAVSVFQEGGSPYGQDMCLISTTSDLYVTSQYVTTISTTDTVDTTFYTDLNSVTATETLNSQTADYAFSFNPTQTANVVTGGTFIIIGAGETTVRNIVSSLNSVHGGTAGNWYKNTNVTYGSETWAAATTNEAKAAVQEAMAVAQNRMTGTAVAAVSDANWPAFGTLFAIAITLRSTSTTATPTVDGVSFNYDGNVINRISYGYTIEMPAVGTMKLTAPASGGPRNARVYIS